MKLGFKVAVMFFIFSLCTTLSVSVVYAQTNISSITSVSSPTTKNLNSVFLVNNMTNDNNDLTALDAWAVGDSGTILHWNGSAWSSVAGPTTDNLYSVAFINSSYGWAVGGSSNKGVVLNYNNGNWGEWKLISFSGNTTGTDTVNATLYSITLADNFATGWIVGANGITLSWCGSSWFNVTSGTTNTLRSVGMAHNNLTAAWAVGDKGTILMSNGTAWTSMTSPTTATLYAIEMINETNAWAVGGDGNNGTIINLSGTTWSVWNKISFGSAAATDTVNATIYSISLDTASSGWAVGGNGTTLFWGGTEWDGQTGTAGGANLKSVSMVHGTSNASTQAWAVGDGGVILAWTGATWVPEISAILVIPLLLSVGLVIALFGKSRLTRKIFI